VEQEQSPQGRGGFQTLFYSTAGLTEAEVSDMESRLLYFPAEAEPVKRLFFRTSTGKGVVAQIVSLAEPDQYGRKGRYLAHSLVFAPEVLARFEVDPFRVFRRFEFVTTVAAALGRGNFQTGDIPPVNLDLPATATDDVEAAGTWPAAELKKLALLALRVEQQAQERQALTFVGEPAQLERALEAAFLAVPVALRPHCSFDTYFYRCNLVATYFWAVGLPEPPIRVKFAQIDGPVRRVQVEVATLPQTAYEHWVLAAIDHNRLADMARQRDRAFALAEWLENREHDPALLDGSPQLITAVFKADPQAVQAALRHRLGEILPAAMVTRVAPYIYDQTDEQTLYGQLRQGFEPGSLLEILSKAYAAQRFGEPPRDEVKALESLLDNHEHQLLGLLVAYWMNPRKRLPKSLEQADDATYRVFGEMALRYSLVEPLNLLLPGRAEAFLDLYLGMGFDDVAALVEALIKMDETACLSRLSGQLSGLPPKELRKLAKLIDKRPNIPETFKAAVEGAVTQLPPERGVKGVLQAVWRRLPGRD
ncbi:MAG TPA: hypothetical protein VGD99_28330, partial [Anaerolineae bacterium]